MKNDNGIILINPPLWYYQSVPLDIIYAAFQFNLSKMDFNIRDLNLEALQYYLDKRNKNIAKCLNSEDFYNIRKLRNCYSEIEELFKTITQSISPNKIDINNFETKEDIRSLSSIENIICNVKENPYIEFYKSILSSLLKQETKFVALALYHPDQIIPLLTLANMIKQQCDKITIHIFGNLEDQINTKILFKDIGLITKSKLAKYIDSISMGESHSHLVDIYNESLNKNYKNTNDIKLYIFEGGEIFDLDDNTLQCLPQSKFMPKDILNITMSTGCYWNKCSYCSIQTHSKYRYMSIDSIINTLKCVANNGLFPIVRFRDSCLSPNILSEIADKMLQENIKINWSCRVRFEKGFNRNLFFKLKRAGCLMLSFGIESFHPEVSKNMNKGIDVSRSLDVIKECYDCNLAVKLTAIYDYPMETYENTLYNLSRLEEAIQYCVDIKVNKFILFNNSRMALYQDQYGIQQEPFNNAQDFRYFCDYKKIKNDDQNQTQDIQKRVEAFNASYNKFLSEEHLLLYLEKHGLNKCMEYIFDFSTAPNGLREGSYVT